MRATPARRVRQVHAEGGKLMRQDATAANPYCARLDLPVPRLEAHAQRATKPFHLMILALLERGGPMDLEELVERMLAAGISPARANPHTLKKAWHGLAPVYRGPDGRYGLDLECQDMRMAIVWLELRPQEPPRVPPPIAVPEPSPDAPLSLQEVDAAFRERSLYGASALRQAAAILDARGGGPLSLELIEAELGGLSRYRARIGHATVKGWRGDLVLLNASGELVLNQDSAALAGMRAWVRQLARPVLLQQAQRAHWQEQDAERAAVREAQHRQAQIEAASWRRALLHVAPDPQHPVAALVLDLAERSFTFYRPADLHGLVEHLRRYQVLCGLHVRTSLSALGMDPDGWRLSDLKPPQKTMRLNRQGRTLAITPELLIAGTTGISRPLGDPAKVAEYLAQGAWSKLARRMESDAKALDAFYRYGLLHGYVRLRWGFLDERLGVEWELPSDRRLRDLLEQAHVSRIPVELVTGNAPGWNEPWSRAQRCTVEELSWHAVGVRDAAGWCDWSLAEIQAARLVPPDHREAKA